MVTFLALKFEHPAAFASIKYFSSQMRNNRNCDVTMGRKSKGLLKNTDGFVPRGGVRTRLKKNAVVICPVCPGLC